ncbi:uncharacterized protein LOC134239447 [Saccostrea cucullata]|uniref:uncharacterized protein LOC134239447 n=1 Tax=Saccostrea cuccullata TaxID=36930 RepID=UPI002ED3CFC4
MDELASAERNQSHNFIAGICNLGKLQKETASMSSVYSYDDIALIAAKALNGKFRDHRNGDCAGTNVVERYDHAWWNIMLPPMSIIHKINIIFRENYTRHYGYYVYLNKEPVDISGLASLPAVYRGQTEHPSTQNVILFPEGHQGEQMYIYLNKSKPEDTDGDEDNNVLDVCEVEILGTQSFFEIPLFISLSVLKTRGTVSNELTK